MTVTNAGQEQKWPVVQRAADVKVRCAHAPNVGRKVNKKQWKTAVFLPDPQIGYRRYDDGTLDPFHDVEAIDVALQIVAALQMDTGVDKVINLGDFLDLAPQGRFAQEPTFVATTQPSIDYGFEFLSRQRINAPDAEIHLIEGNHDARMAKFIATNAAASYGIKRANMPQSWPVMSLPYLLRTDELGVHYVDAWPTGQVWVNSRLRAIHGHKVRSGGSTANAYIKDNPHISTVFGHVHRIEMHHKVVSGHDGPVRSVAVSPGCLCRTDGAVPSYNSATHVNGTPATHHEDWQAGCLVAMYRDEGEFHLEPIHIVEGRAMFRGQLFTSVEVKGVYHSA